MIKGIAHTCYTVRDLDAAIGFYVEKLGLRHGFDFVNDDGVRFGVYLHVGERTFIEMFTGDRAPGNSGSYGHLCLEVDDVARTVEELRAKGVEISDAKMGGDNSWQAWLADPDGNRIELHGYTPDSKQLAAMG
jgi:catechol 2,3-dioxygenase-like lactoylglutathione lyase family enzyme